MHTAKDFLKECMDSVQNPPLDEMQRNFCVVCANRECGRSGLNQSAFDNRVRNWKSLLFDNVPRAAPDDPRYDNIRAKQFAPAGGRVPDVRIFSPSAPVIAEPAAPEVFVPRPAAFVRAESPPAPAPEAPQEPAPVPPPEKEEPEAPRPAAVVPVAPVASPGNTSFQQGTMLEGGPPPAAPAAEPARPDPRPAPAAPGKTFILDDD